MNRRLLTLGFLAAGIAGCSSGSTGGSTVNGSIAGMTLTVQSSLSSSNASQTTVVLGSWPDGCALGSRVTPKNSQALILGLSEAGAGGATRRVTAPGSFTVGATPRAGGAVVTFVGNDGQCVVTSADVGASGTVHVSAVSASEIDGDFDVTLKSGGHISGTFSAPDCAADDATDGGDDGSPATCQ